MTVVSRLPPPKRPPPRPPVKKLPPPPVKAGSSKKVLAPEVADKLEAIFGDAAPTLLTLLEGDDKDGALLLTQRKMLASSISILPEVERAVLASSGAKGVYPFTTLVTSIQQQIESLQAQQDSRLVAESLCSTSVSPAFLKIAQVLTNQLFMLRASLRDYVKPEHVPEVNRMLEDSARAMVASLDAENTALQQKITQRLSDI